VSVAETAVGVGGGDAGGVGLYFTILFCRLSPQTSGSGNLILLEATQFAVYISS
ncbi:hypothetical protein A2U01_0038249, partial [Trifolium medium]|nr:hypothetical protein [Trifolium medium]